MLTLLKSKNHYKLMKFCSIIGASHKLVKANFNNSYMYIHC